MRMAGSGHKRTHGRSGIRFASSPSHMHAAFFLALAVVDMFIPACFFSGLFFIALLVSKQEEIRLTTYIPLSVFISRRSPCSQHMSNHFSR